MRRPPLTIAPLVAVAATGACGASVAPDPGPLDVEPLASARPGERALTIAWRGRPIGRAREAAIDRGDGIRLERDELTWVARDGARIESRVRLAIEADRALAGRRVDVAIESGGLARRGRADRLPDRRWRVRDDDGERVVAAPVEPFELALAAIERDRRAGRAAARELDVMLPAAGFAVVRLRAEDRPRGALLTLTSRFGRARIALALAPDGPRLRDGDLEVRPRTTAERVAAPAAIAAPDVLALAALPLAGRAGGAIALAPVDRPPPGLAAQRVAVDGDRWVVAPAAAIELPAALADRVAALVDGVDADLDAGLDAAGAAGAEALALGRADCSGRAALFVERARAAGLDAAIVLGYRVDGDRLVGHRWAEIAVEGGPPAWIDPTFREVPAAPGRLIGLARHGATRAELAESAAFAFGGLERARGAGIDYGGRSSRSVHSDGTAGIDSEAGRSSRSVHSDGTAGIDSEGGRSSRSVHSDGTAAAP